MQQLAARTARRLLRPLAQRLDVRIVVLFLSLLLLVQLASFITIRHTIDANARVQIAAELRTGENVLRRLLAQNEQQLTEAARLLAADYGFRSAIASNDRATILDALDNQGQRIGANAALFTDGQQQLIASTRPDDAEVMPLVRANLRAGMAEPRQSTVRVLDGRPFQLVTVPVRAPQLIGHVSMGFAVTGELLHDVEELSTVKIALLARPLDSAWSVLPIGERGAVLRPVGALIRTDAGPQRFEIDGEATGANIVPLARNATHEVAAVVMRSIDEAVAPYRRLQLTLLAITLAGLVVFGVGSLITARRVTGPIKQLSASAERLGAGDYATPVTVTSRDEVHDLAQSFEAMRIGMQQREAQIRRLAYWDELTGLPNRQQFRNLLGDLFVRARASGAPCAVLMLDLDRFKHVNDVLGHAFGDRVLRQIAVRLSSGVLRDADCVARLSGDEFAVCLPDTDADTACTIARRLQQALELPLTLDDQTVDVGAGVGIAIYPAHGEDPDTLLGRAEVAMYAAKDRQSGVKVYDPSLDSASQESLSLLSELRTAVDHDQLRLFLQPKVSLASGAVLGAEALVRWQHPTRGMVAPMRFIPFAEQTGFIRVLTGWMIERCAARSGELRAQGLDLKFAINLSTRDLLDQDLPAKLEKMLARDAMNPRTLCMEITESAIMDDPQRALQTLQRLHDMGLRLSIDDFGTGYSSLAYLKRLPLHELKIDKSFVMAMEHDRADLKIVRSTVDLAHNLGLSVVAEGVENAQTWALLRALECDEAQGYYMARPMPELEFADWVGRWEPPQAQLRSEFAAFTR
ncbi:bifunctional diguanylate cyclase/phosphodiesterase [Rhizobacter sp. Root404]|uniref:putative bifunctional diguanylate cyclase/phosphodiesterase n=1 Tax=Rhizobacter sp. Root404 TaxID=1736528 RepID=UPI0006F7DE5C|nr:EAL domain-containing protein [Rhizobacter sp. Root404]KQW38206.1 diguanylate phosphodiesterase [Rhizobacter sp. Root404]